MNDTHNTCPITGELLPPGATVSATAIRRLTTSVSDLPSLMSEVDYALAGLKNGNTTHTSAMRDPINLQLLNDIDEMKDALLIWATALVAHTRPGLRIPSGWRAIRQAFTSHAPKAAGWIEAPTMVDEVCYAIHRLETLASPKHETRIYAGKCHSCGNDVEARPGAEVAECHSCGEEIQVEASRQLMLTRALDIPVSASRARAIVEAVAKVEVKESTFRSYVHRNKLKPVGYEGGRSLYLPRDLLKLVKPMT